MDKQKIINKVKEKISAYSPREVALQSIIEVNKATFLTKMEPMDFLELTLKNKKSFESFKKQLEDFNSGKIKRDEITFKHDWDDKPIAKPSEYKTGEHPYLEIDDTGKVLDHGGRHRAASVALEGVNEYPVAFILKQKNSYYFVDVDAKDFKFPSKLKGQYYPSAVSFDASKLKRTNRKLT
ncbi:hypothetical protein N9948_01265 [bacterium]|nr:hypothetical protein [bacterium]